MKRKFYVYCLIHPWNGTPCYVGKGSGRRASNYITSGPRHSNKHLYNVYKKAKSLGQEVKVEIIKENLSEEEAFALEKSLIAILGKADRKEGSLCNHTDGGDGMSNPSEETRELLRAHSKLMMNTPERRQLSRDTALKTFGTEEGRLRQSEQSKAYWAALDKEQREAHLAPARKGRVGLLPGTPAYEKWTANLRKASRKRWDSTTEEEMAKISAIRSDRAKELWTKESYRNARSGIGYTPLIDLNTLDI